jgi:hypothetical protein
MRQFRAEAGPASKWQSRITGVELSVEYVSVKVLPSGAKVAS